MINRLLFVLLAVFLAVAPCARAEAAVRHFFAPGDAKAIVLLQGLSVGAADADARALYDKMAVAPTDVSGGKGKGVKTASGDFNMSCVARPALEADVICSIVVQRSERSAVSGSARRAQFALAGAEAGEIFRKLAGPAAAAPFEFANADGQIQVLSTPDRFVFTFQAK